MNTDFLREMIAQTAQRGLTLHGIAVEQHGQTLAAYQWQPDEPHILHSLSKSFTSCAVGMLVDAGKVHPDDAVLSFFPDDAPAQPSDALRAMTVRHLLTMSPGHDTPLMMSAQRKVIPDDNWVRYYLSQPLDRMPGERFVYDSACTYLLSALVQAVTGETLLDYLVPRLFAPLGIARPVWETCPRGITLGCAGLYLRPADILKFGRMVLNGGEAGGQRIVSREWLSCATAKQIENAAPGKPDWGSGYGYQFWRCSRDDAFRGDGAYGQLCIMLPRQDAVIAVTANEDDMQAELDVLWDTVVNRL
ncbi:MAG: serine hydrolase [Eubacteriales bacterium]|nr:serine hydrolase [Eubacteriales bacterium]